MYFNENAEIRYDWESMSFENPKQGMNGDLFY